MKELLPYQKQIHEMAMKVRNGGKIILRPRGIASPKHIKFMKKLEKESEHEDIT